MTITPLRPVDPGPDVEARPSSGGKTLHSIQLLRFVAATLVVIYHSYISFIPSALSSPMAGSAYWFTFGKVGVHLFFVISGYIMYFASFSRLQKFSAREFFLRRLLRVYPVYWVFVALYVPYIICFGTMPTLTMQQYVGMLALTPSSSPIIIGVAWTLSYEVYFYLAFGAVMVLGAHRGTIVLTSLFIISIALGIILRPENSMAKLATNSLLLEFVMGVWIARLTVHRPVPRAVGWLAVVGAVAGFVGGLMGGYDKLPSAIIWGVPSAFLIAGAVILERSRRHDRLSLIQRLSWLGDSSYALYLFHILLITIVVDFLRNMHISYLIVYMIPVMTFICITLSIYFHNVVERPMTRKLHKLTS